MISFVPVPVDHKFRFTQGFWKYAPPFGGKPTPDWYWDPNPGQWLNLPTSLYDISDRNWPTVTSGQWEVPDYDTIYRQWVGLPQADQDYAFWDPVRKKWMRISQRPKRVPDQGKSGPGSDWLNRQGEAIRAAKHTVFELRVQQYIGPETEASINAALDRELQRFRGR